MGVMDNIKKSARQNGTQLQTSEGRQLEQILNKTFYLDKKIDKEIDFLRSVMTRGCETQERVGLHASSLIKEEKNFCYREQVLSLLYKQLQGEQVNAGLKRIFTEGDAIHEKWQRLFIRAGYSSAKYLDVTQFNEKYKISFTPDAICKIPEFYSGLMICEIKSVNTYQYQKMITHPTASKQLDWYMFLTGIKKGFVLCEDKNTQDFKVEVYDYDSVRVKLYQERSERIIQLYNNVIKHGKMVKRPDKATGYDCKKCAGCNMRDACYNRNNGKVRI